jgi:hypothetical protein
MSPFLDSWSKWPEGPLGFPMPDPAAKALDGILRTIPTTDAHAYRHAIVTRAPTELNPGERSDVSWISTESVDRVGEVVLARGMDDGQFRLNPLVTLGHDYDLPPVGRSLWRRRVRDGALVGIKAKTQYPSRPDAWPAGEPWLPDQVFALVQAGLLRGKSIGFLPLEVHIPDEQEVARRGWAEDVRLVVDRWLLLEYACVSLPANQHALVEAVSKGGIELAEPLRAALGLTRAEGAVGFTSEGEVARLISRRVGQLDLAAVVDRAVRTAVERARGRI